MKKQTTYPPELRDLLSDEVFLQTRLTSEERQALEQAPTEGAKLILLFVKAIFGAFEVSSAETPSS
jgi:hypothetical protein